MVGLNFTFAPPPRLVKSFFVAGVFFYLLSAILFFNIDLIHLEIGSFKTVAFAHLFLLGFVMSVIFGAMYQLISVVLEVKLYSIKLAYIHLGLFILGLITFLIPFLIPKYLSFLSYSGSILYLSFFFYVINILLSIWHAKDKQIKFYTIFFAHFILLIGVSYGLLAAFGLSHGELNVNLGYLVHTHIPLVLFGFIGALIAIISTVLLPMFMLSHNFNKDILKALLALFILGSIFAIFGLNMLLKIVIVITIFMMSFQLYDIFKKRMRKTVDVYAKDMIVSIISLVILGFLLLFLKYHTMTILFAIFLFIGFLSSFIVGHIYKIVPFLIWNEKFAPLVGKQSVPMLGDMVDDRLSNFEFNFKIATLIFAIVAVVFESHSLELITKIIFLINAVLLTINLKHIFSYKG